MREYLLFSIAAPMASFGTLAVGERRPSSDRPTKSQVLGIVAAALGIERTEEERLAALRDALGFAVRVEEAGQPAYDYHTAQTPPARKNRRFATRAEELRVPKHELKTILSTREYRTGALAAPALWLRHSEGKISLEAFRAALIEPRFALFAGRKAHPLMLPTAPFVAAASSLKDAFTCYDNYLKERITPLRARLGLVPRQRVTATIDSDLDGIDEEARKGRIEQRRDFPQSRAKWRFGLRQEAILHDSTPEGEI